MSEDAVGSGDDIQFIDQAPMSFAAEQKRIPLADSSLSVEPKGFNDGGDRLIFVSKKVLERIVKHSLSDTNHEVGGVLIGGHYEDSGTEFVEIEAFLEAEYADGRAASFKFTHRTWEAVTRRMERHYPDKVLVGWHHSHPGYGVFLSHHDTFIHQNFFNLEWQVALVVDPLRLELGFFQWRAGRIRDCGFHLTGPLKGAQ